MSSTEQTTKREHGTTASYIAGFVLSVAFTIIPYYLVTRHVVSGLPLLATILGFAVLQMIVQIVFFLHLGREKSPHWQLSFFVATAGIIFVVVAGSLWIMHNLHANMAAEASKKLVNGEAIYQIGGEKTGACQEARANHQVIIRDGSVSPLHIEAQLCDTLTLINEDDMARVIAFGPHDHHATYAGEAELVLGKGRGKTITLSESGTYRFHDHLHEQTAGIFTVAPQ